MSSGLDSRRKAESSHQSGHESGFWIRHPKVTFEPVPLELGIGWRMLLVTWYPGQTEYLGGFECEQDAVHWIKFKSQVWVGT
jgi:hypothetical protein